MKKNNKYIVLVVILIIVGILVFIFLHKNSSNVKMDELESVHADIVYSWDDSNAFQNVSLDMNMKTNSSQYTSNAGPFAYIPMNDRIEVYFRQDGKWYLADSFADIDIRYNVTDFYDYFVYRFNQYEGKIEGNYVNILLSENDVDVLKKDIAVMTLDNSFAINNSGYSCQVEFNDKKIVHINCYQNDAIRLMVTFTNFNSIDKTNLFRYSDAVIITNTDEE